MTESNISPQDIRQYYSSQDRVRYWVDLNAQQVFSSPNAPPSELQDDEDALSSPPSDVESSHSIPPRLMLRYADGRESPIPHMQKTSTSSHHHSGSGKYSSSSNSRSHAEPYSSHQRSRAGSTPSGRSSRHPDDGHERERLRSHSPEEIQILPSAVGEVPPLPSQSHHSRSRSLPRDAFSPNLQDHDPMPISPSQHNTGYASPVLPIQTPHPPPGPKVGFARSQPIPWHPYTNGMRPGPLPPPSRQHFKHSPPSIVYAPSHHSSSQYRPPAIFSYPPKFAPNGMMYSHSVPPTQLPHGGSAGYHPTPVQPVEERPSSSHRHREKRERSSSKSESRKSGKSESRKSGRDRSRSLPLDQDSRRSRDRERPPSPAGSVSSGSTYYVLPSAKQKVHILRSPNTLYTATSATQSPTTPISPAGSLKKPFLQRIIGFAERLSSAGSSKGSSHGGKRLYRRHSTGTRSEERVPGS